MKLPGPAVNELIDQYFGGDTALFHQAIAESHQEAISWSAIELSAKTFPQHEQTANALIEHLLGYLPPLHLVLPHDPFIRALIEMRRTGNIATDVFYRQAEDAVKPIRNQEMIGHSCLEYGDDIYQQYISYLPEYRLKVKERLSGFLGYSPALEHSLVAELHLCRLMANDQYHFSNSLNQSDIQALTIIKYREVLLKKGKVAADQSPLIALTLMAGHW